MVWTKIHNNLMKKNRIHIIVEYSREYCELSYWTLTPLHLSIIRNNFAIFQYLINKGVKEESFNFKIFESFAMLAIRLFSLNKLYLLSESDKVIYNNWKSLDDEQPDESPMPAKLIWILGIMEWGLDKQDVYTPMDIAIILNRTDMIPLLHNKYLESHLRNWIDIAIRNEELLVREACREYITALSLSTNSRIFMINEVRSVVHDSKKLLTLLSMELRRKILANDRLEFNTVDMYFTKIYQLKDYNPQITIINDTTFIYDNHIIGQGAEGIVVLGYTTKCNSRVAIKIGPSELEASLYIKAYPEKINKEIWILPEFKYKDEICSGIMMPCFEIGSLKGFLNYIREKEMELFTMELRIEMILEIAKCLDGIHQKGIAHRDIKSDNILLQPQLFPIFIDFGFANETNCKDVNILCGTAEYIAPEVWNNTVFDLLKADVYSFTILMWEILSGKIPYSDGDNAIEELQIPEERIDGEDLLRKIVCGGSRPEIDIKWHDWIKELLEQCWNTDPILRPNMKQIIDRINCNHS